MSPRYGRQSPQTLGKASVIGEHIQRRYSFIYASLLPPSRPLNLLSIARWNTDQDSTVRVPSLVYHTSDAKLKSALCGISPHQPSKNTSRSRPARRKNPRPTSTHYCRHRYQTALLQSRRGEHLHHSTLRLKLRPHANLVELPPLQPQTTGPLIRHDHGFHRLKARIAHLVVRFMALFVMPLVASLP